MVLTAGQTSDETSDDFGARALLPSLPPTKSLLADRGYDAGWFRDALADRGIQPCVPSRKGRNLPAAHDLVLYRQRHRIENMLGRLKDWRRVATRLTIDAQTWSSQPAP
jgi:transposase